MYLRLHFIVILRKVKQLLSHLIIELERRSFFKQTMKCRFCRVLWHFLSILKLKKYNSTFQSQCCDLQMSDDIMYQSDSICRTVRHVSCTAACCDCLSGEIRNIAIPPSLFKHTTYIIIAQCLLLQLMLTNLAHSAEMTPNVRKQVFGNNILI